MVRHAWLLSVALALSGATVAAARAAPLTDKDVERMFGLLVPDADTATRQRVIREIGKAGDRRFIAPLVDQMRFVGSRDEQALIVDTLRTLAGADAPAANWSDMVVWIGRRPELKPPPGYTGWKGELHAAIDPRFRDFLRDGTPSTVRIEEVQWGGVRVDGIPALVNPRMIAARSATWLRDTDPVFGVSINGDRRAYPLRILDWHEMANDVVGGKPVALAYCTLCGSGVLYDTTAGGRTFEFGSSGFLFRSNKLMYDRQTKTLWNHLTGEPVIGPLVGSGIRLERLPVVVTSWREWKQQHPDTKVADIKTGHDRPYDASAAYGSYFASPGTMFPVWQKGQALPDKARVFVLVLERNPSIVGDLTAAALLAMPTATRLPLLDEFAADGPRAAPRGKNAIDPQLRNEVATRGLAGDTRAYERGGHQFTVRSREELADERGRVWRVTEAALVGPGDERLARLPGHLAYWFGWFAFFPATELYGGGQAQ